MVTQISTWYVITTKEKLAIKSHLQQGQIPSYRYRVAPIREKHNVFINGYEPKGTMCTYQTGKFPHMLRRGNRYQIIPNEIDGNSIWIEPMKKKTEEEMILARRRALERMKAQGIVPTNQVLDNEISTAYRLEIKKTSMTYQLVPPDDHRRNLA